MLRLRDPWRNARASFPISLQLSDLHRPLFSESNLMKEAHCAAPGTKMLMDVVNSYLAGRLHTATRRTISGYMNSCQACNVYKVYNC